MPLRKAPTYCPASSDSLQWSTEALAPEDPPPRCRPSNTGSPKEGRRRRSEVGLVGCGQEKEKKTQKNPSRREKRREERKCKKRALIQLDPRLWIAGRRRRSWWSDSRKRKRIQRRRSDRIEKRKGSRRGKEGRITKIALYLSWERNGRGAVAKRGLHNSEGIREGGGGGAVVGRWRMLYLRALKKKPCEKEWARCYFAWCVAVCSIPMI